MPQVRLRCHSCGSHTVAYVETGELQRLSGAEGLHRHCNQCRGTTRWKVDSHQSGTYLPDAAPPAEGRARILIIDDDPDLLHIVERALAREPYAVEFADNGREAVRLLSQKDYNLILSDIRMPELDGKQLFEFLDKNLPEYRHRVIFLTGDVGNEETLAFLQESNRPFLGKPVDIAALQAMLRKFLLSK